MTSTNATPTDAFTIKGLVKQYPGFTLGPLDLTLPAGSVLAFIGPNGAGKTTLLNCMIGLTRCETGEIRIFDQVCSFNQCSWKQRVGYVGERHGFFQNWTGGDNLNFIGRFYDCWDSHHVNGLAQKLSLPLDKRVRDLSKGNRSKLALLAALGHRPKLLLLDEPFTGLDPLVRNEVHDMLWDYLAHGENAIMYSTHILSDISRLADDLTFIIDGAIVLNESKESMSDKWRRISFRIGTGQEAPKLPAVQSVVNEGACYQVISSDHEVTLQALKTIAADNIELVRLTIDEIAIEVMKGHAHVAHSTR
jgi:ABC-2 type transport system ATP-binding protein